MPWGIHVGKKMKDLPPDYLDYLRELKWIHSWPQILGYIQVCDALK